jgi:two-component system CheB/CheR fusion protein
VHDAELIRDLSASAVTRARHLCAGLFPAELEKDGLASALQHIAVNQEQLFRVSCSFKNACSKEISDKSVALHLYRIAQQAANNAAMHSKAKHIVITLAEKGSGVVLTIEDDGTGIVQSGRKTEGMGLHIMRYRARIIGAVLAITKRPDGGTKVECAWQ